MTRIIDQRFFDYDAWLLQGSELPDGPDEEPPPPAPRPRTTRCPLCFAEAPSSTTLCDDCCAEVAAGD